MNSLNLLKGANYIKICDGKEPAVGREKEVVNDGDAAVKCSPIYLSYELNEVSACTVKKDSKIDHNEGVVQGTLLRLSLVDVREMATVLHRVNSPSNSSTTVNRSADSTPSKEDIEYSIEYFNYWVNTLPSLVHQLLSSKFDDVSVLPVVNNFLVNVMKYVVCNYEYFI